MKQKAHTQFSSIGMNQSPGEAVLLAQKENRTENWPARQDAGRLFKRKTIESDPISRTFERRVSLQHNNADLASFDDRFFE